MFYVIKNDMLYEFGDEINKGWDYPSEAQELSGITLTDYTNEPNRFEVQDGKLVDISQTEEYLLKKSEKQKEARKKEIQTELKVLDLKCIRAMREGGHNVDGIPFIDKYQAEISTLREEYNTL